MARLLHKVAALISVAFVVLAASAESIRLADSIDRFELLNADHWKTGEVKGRNGLILHSAGEQRPPVKRPGEFA
jgi:hypothetical protein